LKLTSHERRSVLGVLGVAQLLVFLGLVLPPAMQRVFIPLWERLGWSTNGPMDLAQSVVEAQQWLAWTVEIDPHLLIVTIALAQLTLSAWLTSHHCQRPWLALAAGMLVAILVVVVAHTSVRASLNDRWVEPAVFCLAYVAPILCDSVVSRGMYLALPEGQRAATPWGFSLRAFLTFCFCAAVVMSLGAKANSPASPRWFDAFYNGLIWGGCAWFTVRIILSARSGWLAAALSLLAAGVGTVLLAGTVWSREPAIKLFGTQWLAVYSADHRSLAQGLLRLIGCNSVFVGFAAFVVRCCGFRFTRATIDAGSAATATRESAYS
jgi:hypothetical protein